MPSAAAPKAVPRLLALRQGKWDTHLSAHPTAAWVEDHAFTTFDMTRGRLGAWIRVDARRVNIAPGGKFVYVESINDYDSYWRTDTGARIVFRNENGVELRVRQVFSWRMPSIAVPAAFKGTASYVLDLERGTAWRDPSWTFNPSDTISQPDEFSFRGDGKQLIHFTPGGAGDIWDVLSHERLATFGARLRLAFFLDNVHVGVEHTGSWPKSPCCGLGPNGGVGVWNLQKNAADWTHQEGAIESVSPNRDFLLVGVNGRTFKGWRVVNAKTGQIAAQWKATNGEYDCPEHIWRFGAKSGLAFRQEETLVVWVDGQPLAEMRVRPYAFHSEPFCASPSEDVFYALGELRRWDAPGQPIEGVPRRGERATCDYADSGRYVFFGRSEMAPKRHSFTIADSAGRDLQSRTYETIMGPFFVPDRDLLMSLGTEQWLCLDRPQDERTICVRMASADGVPFLLAVSDDGAENASENLSQVEGLLSGDKKPPHWETVPPLRFQADLVERFIAEAATP